MPRAVSQATGAVAVTKHDTNNITGGPAIGLYVGGTGDVAVVLPNDDVVTFTAVPAGKDLPVRCKRVNSTGTTATNIVAYLE